MSESQQLEAGHPLGDEFRIERFVEESEFAQSYVGTHLPREESCLIRTFDLARFLPAASVPMVRKRFINEAQQLVGLSHPNLERVLGAGEVDGRIFLATGSLTGANRLDQVIATDRPGPEAAMRVILQVLAGLQEAHRNGYPHRDLTPARIHVLEGADVKVADFALVKLLHTLRGTQEGATVLTPFASPEQLRGDEVGPQADLYAVGAIAHELFTGRPPFSAEGDPLRDAILEQEPDYGDGLAKPLRGFLARALAKNPEDRFDDAESMAIEGRAAIASARQTPSSETPPPEAEETPRPTPPRPDPESPKPPPSSQARPTLKPMVVVTRKGPSPSVTVGLVVIAILVAGALIIQFRPTADPGADTAPAATTAPPSTADAPPTPVEPGLVHSFEPEVVPRIAVLNPLEGIDAAALTPEEKESLLQEMAAEVKRHVIRGDAEAAREAMENLDHASPDDPRFYELEAQVLQLAIQLPPVPEENQEVPLVRVDEPPYLVEHTAPRFPERPPENHREVVIKALVDARGKVVDTVVQEDDEFGSGTLAEAAVRDWTFEPALADGVKVKVWIAIPIRTGGEWTKPKFHLVEG